MPKEHIPRKRFGQHFLKDPYIIAKLITALHPKSKDNLVEIGPGLGVLTKAVLAHISKLHVIEIDKDLATKLIDTYPGELIVHSTDALDFDFSVLGNSLRVFGNLPYNISTPLLFHLLQFAPFINDMLFMLQQEVVMRLIAKPNTSAYGRLSVMVQYACQTERLFDVPPQCFSPPPKVVSSVILLKPYGRDFPSPHPRAINFQLFGNMVNMAFQHRRKTLKNALQTLVPVDVFVKIGIDPQRRPETLSISEFVFLSNSLTE